MTTETREVLKAGGLADQEIDILMANMERDWEESMRNMMVDGTAHPDPNSGPPGPFVAPSSHFGGEIGVKIPFDGIRGLNRKERLTIPKSGVWKVGGRLQELKEGDVVEFLG